METPFDYLEARINGLSLSSAYKIGFQAGIKEVVDWIQSFAVMGGILPVKNMLDTMEAHSPYKKYLWNDHGVCKGAKE